MENRKPYLSDVSDEEWAFVAPHLTPLSLNFQPMPHTVCVSFGNILNMGRVDAGLWRDLLTVCRKIHHKPCPAQYLCAWRMGRSKIPSANTGPFAR